MSPHRRKEIVGGNSVQESAAADTWFSDCPMAPERTASGA